MHIKKILSFLLIFAICFSLLAACGNQEDADREKKYQSKNIKSAPDVPINPDLVSAFGKEMIDDEKETIRTIVTGLQACYKRHLKDKDVYFFIKNVENFMIPYEEYLDEIREDLKSLYDDAKAEGNKDKMTEILTLQLQFPSLFPAWSGYIFALDNGMEPNITEQEAEEAVIEYINGISKFFYGGNIIK